MGFPWASAVILFILELIMGGVPWFYDRHCFVERRMGCWYILLTSDGVVFTFWVRVEFERTIEWLFIEGYILILDPQPFILFEVHCVRFFLFVL